MSSSFSEFTQPGKKPVVNSIFDFSAEALGEIRLWLEQNPPAVPITSVLGFSQFTAQQASASSTDAGVTATTYAAFTSGGPSLTGIGPGKYLVIVACDIRSNSSALPRMGYSVNGAAPADTSSCAVQVSGGFISVVKPTLETLSLASNTLQAQRKIDTAVGSGDFGYRSLTVLKYANI
jgi:hypothetical protein